MTFSTLSTTSGPLNAVATSFGGSSGAAVVVATVIVPPTVSTSWAGLDVASTTLVISGANFDPVPAGNIVGGCVSSISSASATSLTIVFATPPNLGPVTAVVTSFGLFLGFLSGLGG